jgi:hypothetical protein
MYICEHCGEVFEEPLEIEDRPVDEFPETISYYYCPNCQRDNYEEAQECKICGKYFPKYHCVEFCEECQIKVKKAFNTLIEENFTEAEIELINMMYQEMEI